MKKDIYFEKNKKNKDILHERGTFALLEKLGLSRNEAKCYLSSLSFERAKLSEISRAARVNRVNAYEAMRRLVEKGLWEQTMASGGMQVSPTSLESLLELARGYQKQATKLRWKVEDLLPLLLTALASKAENGIPWFKGVQVFSGDDGLERIFERSLAVPRGSVNLYIEVEDFFHPESNPNYDEKYYIPTRLKKDISVRVLARDAKYGRRLLKDDVFEKRQTMFLPPEMRFPCAILIYGNEVAFVWKSPDIVGIIIKGSPVVMVIKMLFEMAWQKVGQTFLHKIKK